MKKLGLTLERAERRSGQSASGAQANHSELAMNCGPVANENSGLPVASVGGKRKKREK
jgi:hypothetical protein